MFQFSYLATKPQVSATFKQCADDFQVDEILGFDLDNEGDHVYLQIEKKELNTDELLQKIVKLAKLKQVDVGLSGLKDRNAITTQWFSVHIAGKQEPDWTQLNADNIRLISTARHQRKLRRGTHKQNKFTIILRNLDAGIQHDFDDMNNRLIQIQTQGVPNYFGEQRFGRHFSNISQAERMFKDEIQVKSRTKRGLYLSAIRSMIFNQILCHRVADKSWNKAVPGELLMLDGSNSYFQHDGDVVAINKRIESGDIHPSGPLWGVMKKDKVDLSHAVFEMEQQLVADKTLWCEGLENVGMKYDRRALRLPVSDLQWEMINDNDLQLKFSLPSGCFATSVLREVVSY